MRQNPAVQVASTDIAFRVEGERGVNLCGVSTIPTKKMMEKEKI